MPGEAHSGRIRLSVILPTYVFTFILNNAWTFSLARLSGARLVRGFLLYNSACALAALANYAVSGFLFSLGWHRVAAAVAGALVGAARSYTMSHHATWKL